MDNSKYKRCIKCKKILVGKHWFVCSSCKRSVGKFSSAAGAGVLILGGAIYKYMQKKK